VLENPKEFPVGSRRLPGFIGKVSWERAFQTARLDVATKPFAVRPMTGSAEGFALK
jgi:hypothetical protein